MVHSLYPSSNCVVPVENGTNFIVLEARPDWNEVLLHLIPMVPVEFLLLSGDGRDHPI